MSETHDGFRLRKAMLGATVAAALALAAPAAAAADIGYRGHAFNAGSVTQPSGQKPQSKLWYVDGIWWGSLFDRASEQFHVHRFDPGGQRWIDTGTVLDERNSSHADTLWDGTHLYVASASDETANIQVFRLSYDPGAKRWARDAGYQTTLSTPPIEAVVIDKDGTGRLWITYTQDNAGGGSRTVYVSHTTSAANDAWRAPYALPVDNAADLSGDDIASVVAYAGGIGVMWSNQARDAIYFAAHADGGGDTAADWTRSTALGGRLFADDHINLKAVQSDAAGRVLAVVKTSIGDGPMADPFAPQIVLLQRSALGAWSSHQVGAVRDDHTRPIVMTDQRTRRLYVFATSPTVADGRQTVYYKAANLDSPSFEPGLGTPFMRSDAGGIDVNDASSTKQDLAAMPSLVVLGSDRTNYWHNTLDLGHGSGTPTPTPTPTTTATPTPTATATPTPPGPEAPRLTGLQVRPSAFRVAPRVPRPSRGLGTRLTFTLSEPAVVRVRVQRARPGRRVGGRCVRVTRANRSARRCTRYVATAVRLSRSARQGTNRLDFSGRAGRRALPAGLFRFVLTARDPAGDVSAPARRSFRIIARRRGTGAT